MVASVAVVSVSEVGDKDDAEGRDVLVAVVVQAARITDIDSQLYRIIRLISIFLVSLH